MGTGWRRAFCTTIPRDPENTVIDKQQHQSPSPSPRNCAKLSFFSTGSNPSTPRFQSQPVSSPSLRCRTAVEPSSTNESPTLHCKATPRAATKSPKPILSSNPSSPRSPLKLSLFRNSFKFRVSNNKILAVKIWLNIKYFDGLKTDVSGSFFCLNLAE